MLWGNMMTLRGNTVDCVCVSVIKELVEMWLWVVKIFYSPHNFLIIQQVCMIYCIQISNKQTLQNAINQV